MKHLLIRKLQNKFVKFSGKFTYAGCITHTDFVTNLGLPTRLQFSGRPPKLRNHRWLLVDFAIWNHQPDYNRINTLVESNGGNHWTPMRLHSLWLHNLRLTTWCEFAKQLCNTNWSNKNRHLAYIVYYI